MIDLLISDYKPVGGNEKTAELKTLLDAVKQRTPTLRVDESRKPYADDNRIQAVYFDGEECNGKPAEIFAYIGFPETATPETPVPAMVLVHGGMGHAYAEWVQYWVNAGYAAIAMDCFGQEPEKGPYVDDLKNWKLNPDSHMTIDEWRSAGKPFREQWFYFYLTDVILGNNILRADSRVQTEHIGITGISWGSIATSMTICYDERFAFAVPVYGGGYLGDSSGMLHEFAKSEEVRSVWDASLLIDTVQMPVLYINGDRDPFFSLDSNNNSAANTPNGSLLIVPKLDHGQRPGSTQPEILRFANEQNGIGEGNIKITEVSFDGKYAVLTLDVPSDVHSLRAAGYSRKGGLEYNGKEMVEQWKRTAGIVAGNRVRIRVPEGSRYFYFSVQGKTGYLWNSKPARASTGLYKDTDLKIRGCYAKKLNPEKLAANIAKSVNSDLKTEKLLGVELLVNQFDERVYDGVFGTKSAGGETLQKGAMFRLASMTKPVTAVAMMIEADRGHLDLMADVSDYLPQYKDMNVGKLVNDQVVVDKKAKHSIKVYQLVAHTSGIGSGPVGEKEYADIPREKLTHEYVADYFAAQPLSYDPGTAQEYSTAAYDVAARIVELVSGMQFDEYLKVNIFDPLGMVDTTFDPTPEQWARMVSVHGRTEDGKAYDFPMTEGCVFGNFPTSYCAAGAALASTGEDYMKFAQMLLNYGKAPDGTQIVSEEMVRFMQTPLVSGDIMPGNMRWGLAVRVMVEDGLIPAGCYGWSGAYGTHFWIDPDNRIVAVYMKNSAYEGGAGARTANQFEKDVMASF